MISESFLFGILLVSNKQNTSVTCAVQRHNVSCVRTQLPEGKAFVTVSSTLADFHFLPEWERASPVSAQSSGLAFFQQTEEASDIQAQQKTSDAKLLSPDLLGLL